MKNYIHFFLFIYIALANSVASSAVELNSAPHQLTFKGYFRVGLGTSEGNTSQARYILPGARAKYRLGNEPETNVELMLKYAYLPTDGGQSFDLVAMREGFASHGDKFEMDHWAQAYFSVNDILAGGDFWFGRRYYDRKSIHLMNHYWLNPGQNSHLGGGIKGIDLPIGSLDIALFNYRDKSTPDRVNSQSLDIRWRDIELENNSLLTLWTQYSERDENAALGFSNQNGAGLGLWIDTEIGKIKNTLAFTLQSGSSITQSDFRPEPVREDKGWNLSSAYAYELNNALFYEVLPDFALQWSAVIRHEDRGLPGSSTVDWYSTGIRPIMFLTDNLSLAFEFGADYVDDEVNNRAGHLFKETIALQIAPDRGFFKRPVLRLFVTTAQWDDDFQGLIGHMPDDAPYATETEGWSVGTQLEWWW